MRKIAWLAAFLIAATVALTAKSAYAESRVCFNWVDNAGVAHHECGILVSVEPEEAAAAPSVAPQAPSNGAAPATGQSVAPAAVVSAPEVCNMVAPSGDPNNWPKTLIELAPEDQWFHRVFNARQFHAPSWDGADSWFVSLNLGPNSGGAWTSHGNPGQIVYRGTSTHIQWCLGLTMDGQWKEQFMGAGTMPAAVNVRIAPHSLISVRTASGAVLSQTTSDMGDLTITLPDSGTIVIAVDYTTAAPTHESLVWWGPEDRTQDINILDAR